MGSVISVLILFAGIAFILGFLAVGAHVLDGREGARKIRKKKVAALERRLDEIEAIARDTLIINPHDITAQQIFGKAKNARRELS